MPITLPFALQLTPAAADKLNLLKDAHNAETGEGLTLTDWMALKLREMAIQAEWSDSVQDLQRQLESDAQAIVRSERARLLALV